MAWVKVTNYDSGITEWLNMDDIELMHDHSASGHTTLGLRQGGSIDIVQKPEDVLDALSLTAVTAVSTR